MIMGEPVFERDVLVRLQHQGTTLRSALSVGKGSCPYGNPSTDVDAVWVEQLKEGGQVSCRKDDQHRRHKNTTRGWVP